VALTTYHWVLSVSTPLGASLVSTHCTGYTHGLGTGLPRRGSPFRKEFRVGPASHTKPTCPK
jgi:hypothetical protein